MSHIQVAAENNRLFLFKLQHIFSEFILPRHTVFKPFKPILRVRSVAGYKIKFFKFKRYDSALVIVKRLFNSVFYADRLVL